MDEVAKLVTNVGFPIAVSIYLLVRFEGKIESLTNSINNLTNKIGSLPEVKSSGSNDKNVA